MTTVKTEPIVWPPTPKTQRELARARFPARPVAAGWPATGQERGLVWELLTSPPFVLADTGSQARRVRGLARMLDWLADQPGQSWQERWLAGGAETAGANWRQIPISWLNDHGWRSGWLPGELSAALRVAICADLVRPSLGWLSPSRPSRPDSPATWPAAAPARRSPGCKRSATAILASLHWHEAILCNEVP